MNHEHKACKAMGQQFVNVCSPVTVTPFTKVERIAVDCCKPAVISKEECSGTPNGCCSFTISQKIRVRVPIEFGANVEVGDPYVNCEGINVDEDCCHEIFDEDLDFEDYDNPITIEENKLTNSEQVKENRKLFKNSLY